MTDESFELRQWYNGHKRKHAYKCQLLISLDGLAIHLFPSVGRRADQSIMHESRVAEDMIEHCKGENARQMICYGDLGYGLLRGVIFCGYKNPASEAQRNFNKAMSVVRICVEWQFGLIIT